ncbi:MAG: hypothetical protein ACLP8X_40670 [Streptosporangiaceae bacterium]
MIDTQQVRVPPVPLVGDGIPAACADGTERPYLSLDAAASTSALGPVLTRVEEFLPSLVFQRPPRRRPQVPGRHRRLRGGALGRSRLRRARRPA